MKSKEVIELYLEVRDRLLKNKDQYSRITEDDLKILLGKCFHVQKWRRHLVIEELMMLGYISLDCWHYRKRTFRVN